MLKARVVYNGYQWMKYYSERNKKVVIASDSEAIQTFEIASGYRPRNDICM